MVKIYTKSCRSTTRQRATAQAVAHTVQAARRVTCDRSSSPIATKPLRTLKRPNAAHKLLNFYIYPSLIIARIIHIYYIKFRCLYLKTTQHNIIDYFHSSIFLSLFFVRPLFNLYSSSSEL